MFRRLPVLILSLVVAALFLDALWVGLGTPRKLSRARENLKAGAEALRSGDLNLAASLFAEARQEALAAEGALGHPSARVAARLPWIGDDVRALRQLAAAAESTALAAGALTDAAGAVGWDGAGVPAMQSGGRIDLGAVQRAAPHLDQARAFVDSAERHLEAIDTGGLVGPVGDAVSSARSSIQDRADAVRTTDDLAEVVPAMLGADGPRRWFLGLQNPGAPRGTGGFLGFWGSLVARDGRLRLTKLQTVGEVREVEPVDVSPEVERRYAKYGTRTAMWAANYSPDVPTTAPIILEIAEKAGLGEFDGVILTDPVWMSYVLEAIGPTNSDAWPDLIGADNVVDILSHRVFETTDHNGADRIQRRIGLDLWRAAISGTPSAEGALSAFARSAAERHLAIFSTDPDEETLLDAIGVAGRFQPGGNRLAVVWQDFSANKAGYFADRSLIQSVRLAEDGSAAVEATVTLHNAAPDGPPSLLLGEPGDGTPVGWWGAQASLYLPADAQHIQQRAKLSTIVSLDREFGVPVSDALLTAPSGRTAAYSTTYSTASAATDNGDRTWTYRLTILPQPSIRPIPVSISVILPEGAEVLRLQGLRGSGERLTFDGDPATEETLEVTYRP